MKSQLFSDFLKAEKNPTARRTKKPKQKRDENQTANRTITRFNDNRRTFQQKGQDGERNRQDTSGKTGIKILARAEKGAKPEHESRKPPPL